MNDMEDPPEEVKRALQMVLDHFYPQVVHLQVGHADMSREYWLTATDNDEQRVGISICLKMGSKPK